MPLAPTADWQSRIDALWAIFDTLDAAKRWADADPYIAAGVYREVDVKPFRKALP